MSGKKQREIIFPEYMSEFQCIGSACEDTCCAGWHVSVDKGTFKKYRNTKHPVLKDELKQKVKRNRSSSSDDNFAKIKMDSEGKCTLLDENHLCTIHKELGPEFLSNTCAMYPRMLKNVAGVVEKSATLSCPEAARLVLLNEKGIEFNQDLEPIDSRGFVENNNMSQQQQKIFWDLRIFIIQSLQNRAMSIEDRLISIGLFLNRFDKLTVDEQIEHLPSLINEFTTIIQDGSLSVSIQQLPKNISFQIGVCKNLIEYRSSIPIPSNRYRECLSEMISGLGMDAGISDDEVLRNYELAYNEYYKSYMNNHEYIMENFLVNYVFSKLFPFDKKSVTESYTMMIINFTLIKLHLIGIAKNHKGLNENHIIKLVQSFSKTVDHNSEYLRNVQEMIKENGYDSLAHMVVLVRS